MTNYNNKSFNKRALNIKEAAEYVCVSRATIVNWIARGWLPCEELPGEGSGNCHFRRIRKEDLDSFLNQFYNRNQINPKEKNENII